MWPFKKKQLTAPADAVARYEGNRKAGEEQCEHWIESETQAGRSKWREKLKDSPFDPTAICPKCCHDRIGSEHHSEVLPFAFWEMPWHSGGEGFMRQIRQYEPERIKRTCGRCGYEWPERVVDGCGG